MEVFFSFFFSILSSTRRKSISHKINSIRESNKKKWEVLVFFVACFFSVRMKAKHINKSLEALSFSFYVLFLAFFLETTLWSFSLYCYFEGFNVFNATKQAEHNVCMF